MLKLDHVTISYDDRPIVKDFCMEMGPGEIISIVGESGSGKTTVIRAILGLLPEGGEVTGGDILYEGKSLIDSPLSYIESLQGKDMTMIFQDSGAMINPIRRIGSQFVEYIRVHDRSITRQDARKKALEMLTQMRLPEPENIMHSYPFQLSGGMRQRVGIAMALTFNPRLLLADEPTSALDVTTQAQIVRIMMEMKKEYAASIIIVTHNLGVAAYMSNHIIVMKDGMIVEEGDRDTILNHPKEAYTKNLMRAIPKMDSSSILFEE